MIKFDESFVLQFYASDTPEWVTRPLHPPINNLLCTIDPSQGVFSWLLNIRSAGNRSSEGYSFLLRGVGVSNDKTGSTYSEEAEWLTDTVTERIPSTRSWFYWANVSLKIKFLLCNPILLIGVTVGRQHHPYFKLDLVLTTESDVREGGGAAGWLLFLRKMETLPIKWESMMDLKNVNLVGPARDSTTTISSTSLSSAGSVGCGWL